MQRKSESAAIPLSQPMLGRIHFYLTAVLVIAGASLAGLVLAGRVHFGPVARIPELDPNTKSKDKETKTGRFQIEACEDCRAVLNHLGASGFLAPIPPFFETWVFKFKGGLLEVTLDAEFEEQPPLVIPDTEKKKRLLTSELASQPNSPADGERSGYIILAAAHQQETPVELSRMMENHYLHIGGMFAFGGHGPLHVLGPLHVEGPTFGEYRLFVSTSGPKGGPGLGINLYSRRLVRFRSLVIPPYPELEGVRIGGNKNIERGKEEIILDRIRGSSHIKLKARFLGEGEIQALMPTK